jgi:acyl-CoA dehydrogenase
MIRDQDTLNQLVDMIRQFVDGVLIPNEEIVAETDEIPAEIVQQMKELGLLVSPFLRNMRVLA